MMRPLSFILMLMVSEAFAQDSPAKAGFPVTPVQAESTANTPEAASPAAIARPQRQRYAQDAAAAIPSFPPETDAPADSLLTEAALAEPLTQKYIRQYTSQGGRQWLAAVMRRGEPYIPFIRGAIAEHGLPPELLYLPVIESGYSATARSRSGAVGLWQFMRNSIAPFGMKTNEWVDERRDFWKATDGALRKLKENYDVLGDWPLALAAYNAGLGGVSRVVKKNPDKSYWELCAEKKLKTETIHYVPKLLAVAEILSHPRRYGVDLSWPADYHWTRIPVPRAASLSLLAKESGSDLKLLRLANQELETGVVPAGSHLLKVPADAAERVAAVFDRTDIELIQYYSYRIRSGDTLLALAMHYGVSVDQIEDMNPGLKARYLQIGQRIIIPAFKDVSPYEHKRESDSRLFDGTHLVKRGESLWSIALAYDVDPEALAEANGMELSGVLREGRSLKVPKE